MYYTASAKVTIGKLTIDGLTELTIERSVDTIGTTAKLTLPRNMPVGGGKKILDIIKKGDPVTIDLGYNGEMATEFSGYLASIGDGTPLMLEVDDAWYKYKHADHITKSYKSVTLEQLLKDLFSGYKIDCVDYTFSGGYIMKDVTPYAVAKKIKEEVGFFIRLNETDKTISCFWPYDFKGFSNHTYAFGTRDGTLLKKLADKKLVPNVAGNSLKFVKKEDRKLFITGKARQKDGKVITATEGKDEDGAERRTMNFGSEVKTEAELKKRIKTELSKHSYDGYEGSVTGFGIPRTMPGDTLTIIDSENPEREGKYLIKDVKITFSQNGWRRENTLSYKL